MRKVIAAFKISADGKYAGPGIPGLGGRLA